MIMATNIEGIAREQYTAVHTNVSAWVYKSVLIYIERYAKKGVIFFIELFELFIINGANISIK